MMRTAMLVLLASTTLLLQGCKTGYNRDFSDPEEGENTRTCDEKPRNSDPSAAAIELYNRLRNLSCTDIKPQGALMGQSAGAGNQLTTVPELNYETLFNGLLEYQVMPAVISVDYEREMVFNDTQLVDMHAQLVEHNGIISISWSPLNPWVSDYIPGTGSSADLAWTDTVDINDLLDPGSDVYGDWKQQVDRVVNLLRLLRNENVAVLWRPLPEMNSPDVWWGVQAGNTDAEQYKALWKQLYDRFHEEGLNNLLWVYSPVTGTSLPSGDDEVTGAPFDWGYPGKSQVDIVAPVIRDNDLEISDYSSMIRRYNKPLGLAEYGPLHVSDGEFGESSRFDASLYGSTLEEDYPAIAYWVSSHSFVNDDGGWLPLALIDMEKDSLGELAEDDYILTQDDIRTIKSE